MCAVTFALWPQWLMIPSGLTCLDLSGLPGLSMEMGSAPVLLPHGQTVESKSSQWVSPILSQETRFDFFAIAVVGDTGVGLKAGLPKVWMAGLLRGC